MNYLYFVIYIIVGIATALISYGFLIEPRRLKLIHYKINLTGVPEQWHGRRIAFLSDIHAGPFYPPSLFAKAVNAVQKQKPDIVLIGGDFVEERTNFKKDGFRSDYVAELSRLKAPLGSYAIYGNHDTEASENRVYVHDLLKDAGITLLANEAVNIDGIILVGLEESYHQKPNLQAALERLKSRENDAGGAKGRDNVQNFRSGGTTGQDGDQDFRSGGTTGQDGDQNYGSVDTTGQDAFQGNSYSDILTKHNLPNNQPQKAIEDSTKRDFNSIIMIHQPDDLPTPEISSDRDLILSGHSHKGQITFFGLPLYTVKGGREHIYGHSRLPGGAQQITSSGLGMVHIYARFFAPPEIVIIELNSQK